MAVTPNGGTYGDFLIDRGYRYGNVMAAPDAVAKMVWPLSRPAKFHDDDFLDDTLDVAFWTVNKTSGATTNFAVQAAGSVATTGGVITDDPSASSGEGCLIYGHPVWSGDKNCGMAVRFQMDAVTNSEVEIGFVDPLTSYSSTPAAITDIDTPAIGNGAVTVALWSYDTSQTLTTSALVMDGDATYATTKVNVGTFVPTLATYYTVVIQCRGLGADAVLRDSVRCGILDSTGMTLFDVTSSLAFEGATLVHPIIWHQNKTAARHIMQIDRVTVWGDE